MKQPYEIQCDPGSGAVKSFRLYGEELIDAGHPGPELTVNGLPLNMRLDPEDREAGNAPLGVHARMRGEHWVNFGAGAGLVLTREIGMRQGMKHNCIGVQYWLRRDLADITQIPWHGPGGPAIEAPLWVDAFGLLNWNWKFWGDQTRMIYASSHSTGPSDEWGHVGYDNDAPETVKQFLKSPWRRQYPGTMVIHGGVFYNAATEHWLALTCRRSHMGYMLNTETAGRGVAYDFNLHGHVNVGEKFRMPEVKLYFGETRESMMAWMGDYVTHYYQEPPEWVFKTHFVNGLAWDNQPTWSDQADHWIEQYEQGLFSGISYSLVTNRPIRSGTLPTGYEPDPNYGTMDEFKTMCHRLADRGIPLLIWMSHSGLTPGAHEIDDDWFIRGINGEMVASWGNRDQGMYVVNPGHPGYIDYTKKWLDFYLRECRCKGVFFDCYGFAMEPDFIPRDFMRCPGDTPVMTIRFMEEIHRHVKTCDPEAIVLGEGVSLDGPIDIFSIHSNPKRAVDGMGPRDFFLTLNAWSPKRIVIDQGPGFSPGSGMCKPADVEHREAYCKYITKLLRENGGRDATVSLDGDLSVMDNLLFVPIVKAELAQFTPDGRPTKSGKERDFSLPAPWDDVTSLTEEITGEKVERDVDGAFHSVPAGIYQMHRG